MIVIHACTCAVLITSFPVPHPAFCHLFVIDLSVSQPKLEMPAYVGIQLCVEGSSIPKPGLHKKAHKVAAPVIRLGYWSAWASNCTVTPAFLQIIFLCLFIVLQLIYIHFSTLLQCQYNSQCYTICIQHLQWNLYEIKRKHTHTNTQKQQQITVTPKHCICIITSSIVLPI